MALLHDLFYGQVSSISVALIGASYSSYQRERRVSATLVSYPVLQPRE